MSSGGYPCKTKIDIEGIDLNTKSTRRIDPYPWNSDRLK